MLDIRHREHIVSHLKGLGVLSLTEPNPGRKSLGLYPEKLDGMERLVQLSRYFRQLAVEVQFEIVASVDGSAFMQAIVENLAEAWHVEPRGAILAQNDSQGSAPCSARPTLIVHHTIDDTLAQAVARIRSIFGTPAACLVLFDPMEGDHESTRFLMEHGITVHSLCSHLDLIASALPKQEGDHDARPSRVDCRTGNVSV